MTLRTAAAGRVRVGGTTVDVDLIVGLARIDRGDDRAALEKAGVAVEQARAAFRPLAIFDAELYGDPARNLSLMSEMIDGIHRGHLSLHYQPKHDLRRGVVVGLEALVRWSHPTRGRIAPDLFVTMAEETGHIGALTEWTFIQAIGEQRRLARMGRDLVMSVNLSGRLLSEAHFTDLAIDLVDDTGARLCLEITETAAMHDPDTAIAAIARLASAGIDVSIDDYGAGLSSLAYLKRIRACELKIDKSFVQALGANQRDALLVKSTIDLAHGLDMKVTAEGVETQEVMAALALMGCDVAQGYFIGRPMPIDELCPHLDAWARRCADGPEPRAVAL
jgi:EAL domain-containing protein (putative c-di-GMP-specific phosphodiesterase class I)